MARRTTAWSVYQTTANWNGDCLTERPWMVPRPAVGCVYSEGKHPMRRTSHATPRASAGETVVMATLPVG